MYKNFIKINKSIKAFTLVEMLVAVTIFSFVVLIAVGALFTVQKISTKTQQTQIILDGVNLSMEQMTRDIHYGWEFHCENISGNPDPALLSTYKQRQSCQYDPNSGSVYNALFFRPVNSNDPANDIVAYYLSTDGATSTIMKWTHTATQNKYSHITDPDVNIKALHFFVRGADISPIPPDLGDYEQPLIMIVIDGVTIPTRSGVLPVEFNLQTTASSRLLDN